MYKGFIEKFYKESQTKNVYLLTEFGRLGGEGRIIFDIELLKELDQFIKSNKSKEKQDHLIQFIKVFGVQQLLPQFIIEKLLSNFPNANEISEEIEQTPISQRQSINRVRDQTQIEEIKMVTQMQLVSEKKSVQSQCELVEELQQPESIVQVINLKQYMGKSSITTRVKLFYKPTLEKDQLESVLGDYLLQFKDNTGILQAIFIKARLKDKFKQYFEQLRIQHIYDIKNFEFHIFKQTYEIKITSETQFIQVCQIPIVEQLQLAIISNLKQGEEIIVPAIIAEIGELKQTNRKIILYTIPKEGTTYYKIPLMLWDSHKNENFTIGETCVFEGVLFKSYGEQVELKSIRTRFKIHRDNSNEYKDIIQLLKEKSKQWLIPKNNEIQIESISINPIFLSSIHLNKDQQYFNTVVKVLIEMPFTFSLKEQKFIKQIQVTSDNYNIQKIDLLGERLCSKIYICENAIIYISYLKSQNQNIFTDENNTQIRILPLDDEEFKEQIKILQQPFQRPQLLSQNELEPEQVLEQTSSQKKKQPIKIKISEKQNKFGLSDYNLKKGLENDEIQGNTITLLEGKQLKSKFNAMVQIDEMFEIRYQRGNLKNQDYRISDETYSGKLTLWNNQIGDYKIGQTIQIDNLYYDDLKQEFKTSFHSKIQTNVPQKNLVSKHKPKKQATLIIDGIEYQNFCFNIQMKQLIEIVQLQQENNTEIPYQYCRGMITEILATKLSQQCPTCNFTKLTLQNNTYECSGQNNIKHFVNNPKIVCYIKCKISDYTASIEAIFQDDICNQYLPQNTMIELHKNQLSVTPYFDSLLYREFTFKLWLSKSKDQDLKKIKIMKIFQSNYQKIIDSYL